MRMGLLAKLFGAMRAGSFSFSSDSGGQLTALTRAARHATMTR